MNANEAKTKVRLKFKVSAYDGVASDGLPEPRWTEKWGVGLFDYEEFHVTDQLLKLPFQETPPKSVCIFSITPAGLRFRMRDTDRVAKLNGTAGTDLVVKNGDQIRIGDSILIEVLLAPTAPLKPNSEPQRNSPAAPSFSQFGNTSPSINMSPSEAPTVQTDLAGNLSAPAARPSGRVKLEEEGPTLTFAPQERGETNEGEKASTQGPIFKQVKKSVEIEEGTANRLRIQKKSAPQTLESFMEEQPVVLAKNARDPSLSSKRPIEEDDGPSYDPVYPSSANLDAEPSLSERLLSAVSRVLRRDELNPAKEKFPLDDFSTHPRSPLAGKPRGPANPWLPTEPKIELDLRNHAKPMGVTTGGRPHSAGVVEPWMPEAETSSARMRGRALVFMLSAGVTLAFLGLGYVSFEKWMSRRASDQAAESIANISQDSFEKGIPVEIIEDKVRKMGRSRP